MSHAWTERSDIHRPQTYEKVFGQPKACQYLGGLTVKGKEKQNVLLSGDVGSGKTSLARIYARALNCDTPCDKSGSPCMVCEACLGGATNLFEYDVPLGGGGREQIRRFIEQNAGKGRRSRPAVLFFDEAQSLTPKACLYLLKRMEEALLNPQAPAYIFATTAPLNLSPALRSRLKPLHVRALNMEDAQRLLYNAAELEELEVERGAFDLVIRYAGRQPRNLIAAMDVATDRKAQKLTLASAKAAFGYDQVDDLEDYFLALAQGNMAAMSAIFFRWRLPIAERIEWIEAYLTSFYLSTIQGLKVPTDPVVDALSQKRPAIVKAMLTRLGLDGVAALGPTWRAMMQFWAHAPKLGRDPAHSQLNIVLFHDHVVAADWEGLAPLLKLPMERTVKHQGVFGDAQTTHATGYLTASDVANIVNAASFLTQRRGAQFDLLVKVSAPTLGNVSDASAVAQIDEVVSILDKQLSEQGQSPQLAALRVAENTSLGPVGFIAMSLPAEDHPDDPALSPRLLIETWISSLENVEVVFGTNTRRPANVLHWRIVKVLLAGFNQQDSDLADRLELSGLKSRNSRSPARLLVDQVRYWGDANPTIAEGEYDGPPGLCSKFDAGLFGQVQSGWELSEFRSRALRGASSKKPSRA